MDWAAGLCRLVAGRIHLWIDSDRLCATAGDLELDHWLYCASATYTSLDSLVLGTGSTITFVLPFTGTSHAPPGLPRSVPVHHATCDGTYRPPCRPCCA